MMIGNYCCKICSLTWSPARPLRGGREEHARAAKNKINYYLAIALLILIPKLPCCCFIRPIQMEPKPHRAHTMAGADLAAMKAGELLRLPPFLPTIEF